MTTLSELVDEARSLPPAQRLEWLIEFGDELPTPDPLAGELQRLPECQSPVSWAARVDETGHFKVAVTVPPSAVVVRGFAGMVVSTLAGSTAQQVCDQPSDLVEALALTGVVSPLRLRGLSALWHRLRSTADR